MASTNKIVVEVTFDEKQIEAEAQRAAAIFLKAYAEAISIGSQTDAEDDLRTEPLLTDSYGDIWKQYGNRYVWWDAVSGKWGYDGAISFDKLRSTTKFLRPTTDQDKRDVGLV